MNSPNVPQTPDQLCEALRSIFSNFEPPVEEGDGQTTTYHSVLQNFAVFFGKEQNSFSTKQLESFGALVSNSVAEPGSLENAFSTCLLEHLHQIRAERKLKPFLSKAAQAKCHA